ncbi:MAG: PepSY domain-containing protein [Myxococcota bacterium]
MPLFGRKDRRYHVSYDLHTWSGLVLGLLLHVMFFTGAIALYHDELGVWEEPAHHEVAVGTPTEWWTTLAAQSDGATRIGLSLPHHHEGETPVGAPTASIHRGEARTALVWRDGVWTTKASHASLFLFRLHFLYHPSAEWLVTVAGFVSLFMGLALLTGLVIHVRDLWRDLDRFRPEKPVRSVWVDLHKITAVLGLPFQALFAYTGAVLCLANVVIGIVALPLYAGDVDRIQAVLFDNPPPMEVEATPQPMLPLTDLLARAEEVAPGLEPVRITVTKPGLATAEARIRGERPDGDGRQVSVLLAAATGELRHVDGLEAPKAHSALIAWLFGLHFAQFGGALLVALYALLSLATSAAILSGTAIWLGKRQKARYRGARVLGYLTTGLGAGVPLGSAAILLASRALPWDLPDRTMWLEVVFLVAVVVAIAWSVLQPDPRRAWAGMVAATGVACALTPLAQAQRTAAGVLGASPQAAVVAVDLGFWFCAVVCGAIAAALWRRTRVGGVSRGRPARAPVAASAPAEVPGAAQTGG